MRRVKNYSDATRTSPNTSCCSWMMSRYLRLINASEQALRWSVIFRKITNGFRSEWGADLFAMIRSLFGTAYRQSISAFDAISLSFTSSHPDWLLG